MPVTSWLLTERIVRSVHLPRSRATGAKTTWPDFSGVVTKGEFLLMAAYKTVLGRKFQTGDGFGFFFVYRLLSYFWE